MASNARTIACIAAHPDDIEFGLGGALFLLKDKGYDLHFIVLTSGQKGIKGMSPDQALAVREKEQRAACDMLGAELTFMREMDGQLFAGPEVCRKTGEVLKEIEPVAVFTFWPINVPDHSAAFHIAQRALYFADAYYTPELYLYATSIGGQTNHFHPDIYVNISQVAEKKVELIRCHESQCGGALDEHLLGDNKFRGREARVEYAEGFKPIHKMVGTRWERRSRYLLLDL